MPVAMLSRRAASTRIRSIRPLRPPNAGVAFSQPPRPRPFTYNARLRFVAQRTSSRPQLPYLSQPSLRAPRPGFLGPNPQLARLLSTETRHYVKEQVYLAGKWTVILWTFVFLGYIAFLGVEIEQEERRQPTPDEYRFRTRWALRNARQMRRSVEEGRAAFVDWAAVGSALRFCLARLENPELDGKGVVELEEGGLIIPGAGKAGLDISGKDWPWRAGYFEVVMGCAAAAEHLDGMVLDRTRGMVFPKEVVIGPSNPDPRPTPPYMAAAPKEEDCVPPFEQPETYYMRVLTTRGFTTKQKLGAALAYANWLEYKNLNDSAEEMYAWAVDIATAGLPTTASAEHVIDGRTFILKEAAAQEATPNLLHAVSSLAIHRARTGDVSSALPILLSVLRARRGAPVSPFPQPLESTRPAQEEAKTDIAAAMNIVKKIFAVPQFPPPPPSGDLPLVRSSDRPTCGESELMLYIGEILFATSPAPSEGLGWTRQAVAIADANLQSNATASDHDERAKCKQCLTTGVANWETMLRRLSTQAASASFREGGRSAGFFEWRGWFGGDGGQKGKTLGELSTGVLQQELKQADNLKERIARDGIAEEMRKARGPQSGLWVG